MKFALALLLSIVSTQAFAAGIAFYDQPFGEDYRVVVMLSDVPKQADECHGSTGQLGKMELTSQSGREVKGYVGCWHFVAEKGSVTFTSFTDGEWRHWDFPVNKFQKL
jgi:hypothetical protein